MAVGLAKKTSRGDLKRKRILEALRRCIIAKGYAKTTLAEIAIEAELYPSHVLYYFSGKEAILEFYFAQVSSLFRRRLNSFKDEAPSEKIRSLTDFFFADNAASHSEIGFMLECWCGGSSAGRRRCDLRDLERATVVGESSAGGVGAGLRNSW